jgi:hypothetical protein
MATVLGLALKINADASAVEPELSKVDKALAGLGQKADGVAALFDQFKESTSGAGAAQESIRQQLEQLGLALQEGALDAKEYAAAFAAVEASAQELNGIFQEGARTTAKYRTETETVALEMERLNEQLKAGAIDQATYERAVADVTGANQKAAEAERAREQFLQRAAQLTQAVITPMEKYDATVQELRAHLEAGTITQQTYERSLEKAAQELNKAEAAAKGYDKAAESAGKGSTLAFNELSGILSAIPGPIGNIAGRLSGLSSAAEGLGRIFTGGLGAGFSSLAGSVTALLNPFTLAVAGIAAFGAAAAAIASGLQQLTGRVEQLQNTASRLGTTFEFVQVLEEAANRSGVAVDQLATGLQKFAVNVDKAREGGNTASEAFDRLGISQEELQNTDPTELAVRVADALGEIEDPATRARIATELLGKSGLELLPAFQSIDPATKAIDKFRASISIVEVGKLAELDDVFDDIGVALRGLGTQLLLPFTGLAKGVADALTEAISGITRFIDPILDALEPVFDLLGTLISDYAQRWADFAEIAGNAIGGFIEVVVRISTIIGEAFTQTVGYVAELLTEFGEFTGLGGVISSVASGIASAFSNLWEGIKQVVGQVGGFISQVLDFAEKWLGIERGVDAANDAYRAQAKIVKETAEASAKKAQAEEEAARKAIEANTKIVDSLLEQLDIDEQFGGDNQRAKAAKNVQAIEEEIGRLEAELQEARESGDQQAIARVSQRLQRLDQILAQERDIASGAAADRKQAAAEQQKLDKEREDARKKLEDDFRKAVADNVKEIDSLERKLSEERFEIERDRIEELNKLRLGALEIGDIRAGGADVFQDLLGGREDKAIAEYKKQLDELKGLRDDLKKAQAKKAEILRGAPV